MNTYITVERPLLNLFTKDHYVTQTKLSHNECVLLNSKKKDNGCIFYVSLRKVTIKTNSQNQ